MRRRIVLSLWLAWWTLRGRAIEIVVGDNFAGGDRFIAVPKRGWWR